MKKLKILKFMPKNLKTILIIIINDIIISGTLVFAYNNYLAKDVEYEKNDGTKISVENALNELYAGNKDSANNNYMFVYNKVANKNYTLNTGNTENRSGKWEFNDKGLDLYISSNYDSSNDTDAKYTYWCYIKFKVQKAGNYMLVMNKTNQQQATNTSNPLYYGISDQPVTSRSTYNVADVSSSGFATVKLEANKDYYIGANFDLTWNYWGYGKISFGDVILVYLDEK